MVVSKATCTATPHHMIFEPTSDREFTIASGYEGGQMRGKRRELIFMIWDNFSFIKAIW